MDAEKEKVCQCMDRIIVILLATGIPGVPGKGIWDHGAGKVLAEEGVGSFSVTGFVQDDAGLLTREEENNLEAECAGIMKRHGSRKLRQCSDACGQYGRTRLGTGGIRNGTGSIFRIWTGADQGTDIRRLEAVAKADHKSVVLQQPFPVL